MKLGLLGYAQSGKKTLFELLTGRAVPQGQQDAYEGIAKVRDPNVDTLAELVKPDKITYAENNVVLCSDLADGDTARKWLADARQCDMLSIVIRDFAADDVYHPAGSVDADRDRRNLEAELILSDLEIVENRLARIEKEKKAGQSQAQILEEKALRKCVDVLEQEKELSTAGLEAQEHAAVRNLGFLTLKPVLWTYNVDESRVAETRDEESTFVVSCKIEQEISSIEDLSERKEYLEAMDLSESGLDRMNRAGYNSAGLMSFYTAGPKEVRAWTIRSGVSAPGAGGKIHSDIERGFIRVEIIKFADYMECGGEKEAKDAGKMQLKGKDYILEEEDVCLFRFNV